MITVRNAYFIAHGTPDTPLRGRVYCAEWKVYDGEYLDDDGNAAGEGDLFAEGHVKWDGCSNWSFKAGDYMHHQCTREGLTAIGDILSKCWDASASVMPDVWNVGTSTHNADVQSATTQPNGGTP